jgi:hydroxyatrazine ethylaminohydrolase
VNDLLIENIDRLITCDADSLIYEHVDLWIEQGVIRAIGADLRSSGSGPSSDVRSLDGRGLFVYPGLINTHHHFFQAFVRNRVDLNWPMPVLDWIDRIYPLFAQLTEPCFYHSTLVSLAELIKHGCTTAFDHQYCFPAHAGSRIVDQQFAAAQQLGIRLNIGRGANTLHRHAGGCVPDDMVETTADFLRDCERLIDTYHDPAPMALRQVTVAPCQPVNCHRETFTEALALARDRGVTLHTHLGEGESALLEQRTGRRTLEWCEQIGFCGADVWYAHGWELRAAEIERLGASGTGLSHCPAPVCLVGEAITDLVALERAGCRIGMGVDGQASNDNSNLMDSIRLAYLLQCLAAPGRGYAAPRPAGFLEYATRGGAALLCRPDLGSLQPGLAGDLFAIDTRRIEFVGVLHDPMSLPAKVGFGAPVDLTVANGRVLWHRGEFPGLDERALLAAAAGCWQETIGACA